MKKFLLALCSVAAMTSAAQLALAETSAGVYCNRITPQDYRESHDLIPAAQGRYSYRTKTDPATSESTTQPIVCHLQSSGGSFLGANCPIEEIYELRFEKNPQTGLFKIYQVIHIPGVPEAGTNHTFAEGLSCELR